MSREGYRRREPEDRRWKAAGGTGGDGVTAVVVVPQGNSCWTCSPPLIYGAEKGYLPHLIHFLIYFSL